MVEQEQDEDHLSVREILLMSIKRLAYTDPDAVELALALLERYREIEQRLQ